MYPDDWPRSAPASRHLACTCLELPSAASRSFQQNHLGRQLCCNPHSTVVPGTSGCHAYELGIAKFEMHWQSARNSRTPSTKLPGDWVIGFFLFSLFSKMFLDGCNDNE